MEPKPGKRIWERLVWLVAILIAVALVADGYFAVRAEWRLKSRIAAIRAAGDPASIADLEPPAVPDDGNAAAILKRSHARLDQFSKEYFQFSRSPLGIKYDAAVELGHPPSKKQLDAIRKILTNYPDVEQAILGAAACEQYASQLDFSLDHTAFIQQLVNERQGRNALRFLRWRNEVLLADGQQEAAIKNSLQGLRLGRLYGSEPSIVMHQLSIAMRGIAADPLYDGLAAGPVSPELHAVIDKELALQDDPDQLARSLITERAIAADWINSQFSGRFAVVGHALGWAMKDYQSGALDEYGRSIKLAGQPFHQVRGTFGPAGTASNTTGNGPLADLLQPSLRSEFEVTARNLAVMRSLRIYNALRAFADKNKREANGLVELNLPSAQTLDPYSGQPLKLKYTGDGWIVYSVMENGVDDGGDFIDRKDFGVAPPRLRLQEKKEDPSDTSRDESAPVEK
jgi:hypothetical protein